MQLTYTHELLSEVGAWRPNRKSGIATVLFFLVSIIRIMIICGLSVDTASATVFSFIVSSSLFLSNMSLSLGMDDGRDDREAVSRDDVWVAQVSFFANGVW